MKYEALKPFTGVVGGAETPFAKGEIIPADVAAELGLAQKPELAKAVGK